VEVLLVPFDVGATLYEGADAFDATVATTDSLEELVAGRGAFVTGVADGYGIALVPVALTDDVQTAVADEPDLVPEEPLASCASDCVTWCATTLDACDGLPICDCTIPADEPEEAASCTWDCAEWCSSPLEYCGDDAWDACADTCEGFAALPPPAFGLAGEWSAPVVVDGVALAFGVSDPATRAALGRSQPIGAQVGGTYGRQADQILVRLLEAVTGAGMVADDPSLSCGQRLLNRGYRPTQTFAAGDTVRVGICQNGGLEVWPQSLGILAGGRTRARFVFDHLPGTPDALVTWSDTGRVTIPAGRSAAAELAIDPRGGLLPLDVVGSSATFRVRVTVQP
jgi:hypothetical protein